MMCSSSTQVPEPSISPEPNSTQATPETNCSPSSDEAPTDGTFGFDLSTPFSVEDFKAMKQKGYKFVVIRAYRSNGECYQGAVNGGHNASCNCNSSF